MEKNCFTKNVLITGASKGIGKATAYKFAREGYSLVLCCKSHFHELTAFAEELFLSFSVSVLCFQTDVSDYEKVSELFAELDRIKCSIDILINNAGIAHIGLLSDLSPEEWNCILSTNLSSVFYFSKHVIPDMVRRKSGKIINISSVWGNTGASCEVAYSATKGGMNAFTKALAKELAPSNIQVNAIACGVIDTDMNQQLSPEERVHLQDEIPSCRFGTPQEVADFIYSISSGHPYLTGQILTFDGGWI